MTITERTDDVRARRTVGGVVSVGYGALCYVGFVLVFLYAIAFLADVVVPRTVDHGGPTTSTTAAVVLDAVLLSVFAVQHSVMARPAFKRRWTRLVPAYVERSTYVLAATAALALVLWQWRPIPDVVWDVPLPAARVALWVLYALGWGWVLAMSFAIDHLEMLGLRQVVHHLRGLGAGNPRFALPWPHRLVRHPMMLGFFPAFLAAPTMTAGHLLFGVLGCGYILAGVRLEEHDLADALPEYRRYAAGTPRFIPGLPTRDSRGVGRSGRR